jgi:hypothetical protein
MDFSLTGQVVKTSPTEESSPPPTPLETPKNQYVDRITMELMMNKAHYKSVLAKTDQARYQETREKMDTVREHREDVITMVKNLLDDFSRNGNYSKYTTQVNRTFEAFLGECMQYIADYPEEGGDQDDDMLFPSTTGGPKKAAATGRPKRAW